MKKTENTTGTNNSCDLTVYHDQKQSLDHDQSLIERSEIYLYSSLFCKEI